MDYFTLAPEVPGGFGEHLELTHRPGMYPIVTVLHFEFGPGSLGNDLMTSHPVFMVTERLAAALRQTDLSGFELSTEIEVSVDDNIRDLEPDWPVPHLEWLQVTGEPGVDDFGLTSQAELVASETALGLLRQFNIDFCDVTPFDGYADSR